MTILVNITLVSLFYICNNETVLCMFCGCLEELICSGVYFHVAKMTGRKREGGRAGGRERERKEIVRDGEVEREGGSERDRQ